MDLSSTLGELAMETEVVVVKTAECSSSSGKSTLTYQFGTKAEEGVQIRFTHNTGGGMFHKDWVAMKEIIQALRDPENEEVISAVAFRSIYLGRSINTPSFLLAALKQEGVIVLHATKPRNYQIFDVDAFEVRIGALSEASSLGTEKPEDGKKKAHKPPKEKSVVPL